MFKFTQVKSLVVTLLLILMGGVVGFRLGRGDTIPIISNLKVVPASARLFNISKPEAYSKVDFSHFWEVWGKLENAYFDSTKLEAQKMVDGAIAGMTAALGDPYTMYLPKEDQKRTSDDLQGEFDGVGIQLGYKNQTLVVVAPLKGLPAQAAGVEAGDYIIHIKDDVKKIDRDTSGISLPEAVSLIRGPKGSQVTLTFLREGGKPEEKTLKRDTIVVPSVELSFVTRGDREVAVLKLSQFGGNTNKEWDEAVSQIASKGDKVKGMVLDLRNNPGGYLQEAVSIGSEFITSGLIVSQEGKSQKIPYYAYGKGKLEKMNVVVLINKGSASASEIVAGALRDRKGAKLVGENSFGKGTVQDAVELPDGSGLHVTVAKWLTPNGTWVHEKGLKPDVEVHSNDSESQDQTQDKQLDEAIKQLQN